MKSSMGPLKLVVPDDTTDLFRAIAAAALAVLVMLGVGGTAYLFLAPDGWLAELFGRSVAGGIAAVFGLAMVGACVWMTRAYVSPAMRSRFSELFAYGFAGAGALYAVEFLSVGVP